VGDRIECSLGVKIVVSKDIVEFEEIRALVASTKSTKEGAQLEFTTHSPCFYIWTDNRS
jgi:hypothetical protein